MQQDQFESFKFIPPDPPFGFMNRPRLLEPLVRGLSGRLVLIQAPSGYGKTSLLASLAAAWANLDAVTPHSLLAWYQLAPSDDDPTVFLEGMVESVRRVLPSFGKTVLAALRGTPDARADFQRLVDVFQDELRSSGERTVFVMLDDFHLITDKMVNEVLEHALRDPSSPLRLLIATETEPRFYLSHLRTQDVLVELGADDLLFAPDEVETLLTHRVGSNLGKSVVDTVVREAGGWPSATALAAVIVARSKRPLPFNRLAPTEHGYTQLVKEVLAGLPADIREALLHTALLPRVESATALTLAGVTDPQALFRLVEESKLPASWLGGSRQALGYDPLFGAALKRELSVAVSLQDLESRQTAIARYLAQMGRWDEAIRGYIEVSANEEAAALAEAVAGVELARGHLETVLRWLRAIPSATRKVRPRLMVYEARALLAKGQVHDARAVLARAQPELEAAKDNRGVGQRTSSWSMVHMLDGRYLEAARISEEAMRQLPEDEEAERAEVCWLLATIHEVLGDLPAAFSAASEGLLLAERSGEQQLVVRALSQLSALAELRGDYTEALGLAGRAVKRSVLLGTEELAIASLGGMVASIYLERGQIEEAVDAASMALDASRRLHDVPSELRASIALLRAGDMSTTAAVPDLVASELLIAAGKLPARRLERTLVLQTVAAVALRQGKTKEGNRAAWMALDAAVATAHQPLIQQCQLLAAAAGSMGLGFPGPLLRTRGFRDALAASDGRRWLSGALLLLAQGYARLGIRWRTRVNLEKSLRLAAGGGYLRLPLGIPPQSEMLFSFAVHDGLMLELAGTLLGVDPARGEKLLAPLLSQEKPELRARAEKAAKGLRLGLGRSARPRLRWPGLADGMGSAERVALQSLGGIVPFVDCERAEWPSPDARNLAAYFVVNRDSIVPRETVLHDVWPDVTAAEAHVRLQVALYRIPEVLGPGYPRADLELESRGGYRWSGEGCLIDVERFRDLLLDADRLLAEEQPPVLSARTVEILDEAVDVYQGEFLPELDFDWCVEQREQLRAQLLKTTRLLMDHHMALREWRDAIRYGLKSLKSDPLQEDVVRDLMVCYFRIGDRDSVMQKYREVKRLLARQRGEWPSDETRKLRVRLLGK
jgi:ATP/maltotriose-dependent transcriptional regulator MalT/DNA-binding SARP family transcriptional activator